MHLHGLVYARSTACVAPLLALLRKGEHKSVASCVNHKITCAAMSTPLWYLTGVSSRDDGCETAIVALLEMAPWRMCTLTTGQCVYNKCWMVCIVTGELTYITTHVNIAGARF